MTFNLDNKEYLQSLMNEYGSVRAIAKVTSCHRQTIQKYLDKYKISSNYIENQRKRIEEKLKGVVKQEEKIKYLEKINKRELDLLRKRHTLFDIIGEPLIRSTKALEANFTLPVYSNKIFDEEELGLMWSDFHAGLLVDSEESGGLAAFNVNILEEEIDYYQDALNRIIQIHSQQTGYKVCNVFIDGDLIEGKILRPAQLRTSDLSICDSVIFIADKLAKILVWLSSIFEVINVYGTSGNHARFTQQPGILSPFDTLDYLIMRWIEKRCENCSNIKFTISRSWWLLIERMGFRFYMEHGEDFISWLGIPFYALRRGKANIRDLLRQYLDAKGVKIDFDYCLFAHIHEPSMFNDIITNGSWCGGTEWSLKRLKLGGAPKQKVFSIHPKFGITWTRDIILKDLKKNFIEIAK